MEQHKTPITDEYLKSLEGIKAAEPSDFFYSRLTTKLANEQSQKDWVFPLKPIWMICTLAVLLLINTIILAQQSKPQKNEDSSIEGFANAYDQNISSY
jgi:hypothetical protein